MLSWDSSPSSSSLPNRSDFQILTQFVKQVLYLSCILMRACVMCQLVTHFQNNIVCCCCWKHWEQNIIFKTNSSSINSSSVQCLSLIFSSVWGPDAGDAQSGDATPWNARRAHGRPHVWAHGWANGRCTTPRRIRPLWRRVSRHIRCPVPCCQWSNVGLLHSHSRPGECGHTAAGFLLLNSKQTSVSVSVSSPMTAACVYCRITHTSWCLSVHCAAAQSLNVTHSQ